MIHIFFSDNVEVRQGDCLGDALRQSKLSFSRRKTVIHGTLNDMEISPTMKHSFVLQVLYVSIGVKSAMEKETVLMELMSRSNVWNVRRVNARKVTIDVIMVSAYPMNFMMTMMY